MAEPKYTVRNLLKAAINKGATHKDNLTWTAEDEAIIAELEAGTHRPRSKVFKTRAQDPTET